MNGAKQRRKKMQRRAPILSALLVLLASTSALASIPSPAVALHPVDREAFRAALDPAPNTMADEENRILLLGALDSAFPPAELEPFLPETRVGAFEVFEQLSRRQPDELTRALHRAYGHPSAETASDRTVLTPDPLGYQDSSNLYAFAGGDPVNNSDPTGLLCEGSNASGFFNWVGRCAQDSLWVGADTFVGMYDPRNTMANAERAKGGIVGVTKFGVDTTVGIAQAAYDTTPTGIVLDPIGSTQRTMARVKAVGGFLAHPIDTVVNSHSETFEKIIQAEQIGDQFGAGMLGGELGAADAAAVIGAAETGVAAVKLARNAATKLAIERIGYRTYENSLRTEARRMVVDEGRSVWEDSFNVDLGREAGRRAQVVIQRWARGQTGRFATPNWAFGDIQPQLRMFPPANPQVNPLVSRPRSFVIPDVYYRPLSFGLDFKLTNYTNLAQDWGYATYLPLSEIRKVVFNPYAYPR